MKEKNSKKYVRKVWELVRFKVNLTPVILPVILVLFSYFYTSPLYAAEYKLIKGKQYALCRDYLANLKSLGSPSMMCHRQLNPKMKKFRAVQWKRADPANYKSAIRDLFFENNSLLSYKAPSTRKYLKTIYQLENDDYPPLKFQKLHWENYWQKLLNEHNKGVSVVKHGRIDMDRDGGKEHVFFVRAYFADRYICPERISNLLVLKDDNNRMDKRFTYLTRSGYDLFYYDGLPRHSTWDINNFGVTPGLNDSLPSLWIYDFGPANGGAIATEVCIFQYYQNMEIKK